MIHQPACGKILLLLFQLFSFLAAGCHYYNAYYPERVRKACEAQEARLESARAEPFLWRKSL